MTITARRRPRMRSQRSAAPARPVVVRIAVGVVAIAVLVGVVAVAARAVDSEDRTGEPAVRSAPARPVVARRGRHLTPKPKPKRMPTRRTILTTAGALGAAVVLGSVSAFGSYAFLNSQAALSSGGTTLAAGALSVSTAINGSASTVTITPPSKLLPGDYYQTPLSVSVAGDVQAALTAAVSAASSSYEVRISTSACPSLGSTTTGYSAIALGSSVTTSALSLGTVANGSTLSGCIQVGMLASAATTTNNTGTVAPTTASAPFTVTFSATQASG